MKPYKLQRITMSDPLFKAHVEKSTEPALESLTMEHKRQFTRPERVVQRLAPFEVDGKGPALGVSTPEVKKKESASPMDGVKEPGNDAAKGREDTKSSPSKEGGDGKATPSPSVPSTPTTSSAPGLPLKRPTPGTLSVFPWAREGLDEEGNRVSVLGESSV